MVKKSKQGCPSLIGIKGEIMKDNNKVEKYLYYVLFICIGSCLAALLLSASIGSDFYSLFIILVLATTISPLICIGLVKLIEKTIKKEKQ